MEKNLYKIVESMRGKSPLLDFFGQNNAETVDQIPSFAPPVQSLTDSSVCFPLDS